MSIFREFLTQLSCRVVTVQKSLQVSKQSNSSHTPKIINSIDLKFAYNRKIKTMQTSAILHEK
ncbi:MAG: hypothetical protein A4S08_05810 [Proteobacteria bacterium SG_bin4]|nr:MAG: hypothetical protein A4S08_05810 [Proteobacteria bacterium SG_bin4]